MKKFTVCDKSGVVARNIIATCAEDAIAIVRVAYDSSKWAKGVLTAIEEVSEAPGQPTGFRKGK